MRIDWSTLLTRSSSGIQILYAAAASDEHGVTPARAGHSPVERGSRFPPPVPTSFSSAVRDCVGCLLTTARPRLAAKAAASAALAERLAIPLETCTLSNSCRLGAGELLGRNAMLIFNALFLIRGATDLLALGLHAGVPYFDCSKAFVRVPQQGYSVS